VLKNQDNLTRTRATLLARLKDWGDGESWQAFFDVYWKLIYAVARKSGLSDAEAQDVVQETMVAVAKHIPTFQYDPALGSFKAWLLNLTRWRIVDQLRKRGPMAGHRPRAGAETGDRTATIERFADENCLEPDAIWDLEWKKTILEAAMKRVRSRLPPQKFQVFDFYVNREWPPEKVAHTFKISVNQVYLIKNRVTAMLRDEARKLEHQRG
jgi:RNA polymerase sigma factor (sigma-70 family)